MRRDKLFRWLFIIIGLISASFLVNRIYSRDRYILSMEDKELFAHTYHSPIAILTLSCNYMIPLNFEEEHWSKILEALDSIQKNKDTSHLLLGSKYEVSRNLSIKIFKGEKLSESEKFDMIKMSII